MILGTHYSTSVHHDSVALREASQAKAVCRALKCLGSMVATKEHVSCVDGCMAFALSAPASGQQVLSLAEVQALPLTQLPPLRLRTSKEFGATKFLPTTARLVLIL